MKANFSIWKERTEPIRSPEDRNDESEVFESPQMDGSEGEGGVEVTFSVSVGDNESVTMLERVLDESQPLADVHSVESVRERKKEKETERKRLRGRGGERKGRRRGR